MTSFLFWMLVAAGLGFLKAIVLAQTMVPLEYGHYVTILGGALLAGAILSFGAVEVTAKLYPRLWVDERRPEIRDHAARLMRRLGARFLLATGVVALAAHVVDIGYSPFIYMCAGLLGLLSLFLSVVAALVRAVGQDSLLQRFTLTRAGISFVLTCVAGWKWGGVGAILGEAVAAGLSLLLARWSVFARFSGEAAPDAPKIEETGGGNLYLSRLLTSSTELSDRGLVNAALGAATAGSYGVLALVFQAGQLLANIMAQRIGPSVVKMAHSGYGARAGLVAMKEVALLMFMVSVGILVMIGGLKYSGMFDSFFGKYDIGYGHILLASGISFFQIYNILMFVLIAEDRERQVLWASLASAIFFYAAYAWGAVQRLDLYWFLASILMSKVVLSLALLVFMRTGASALRSGSGGTPAP